MRADANEIRALRAGVRRSLPFFAAVLRGKSFLTPFHLSYYRVLNEFAHGRIQRLIVTIPPQHGKSEGSSVLLPAYLLGLNPDLRIAIASYSATLASKFNRRVQRIIESKEYGALFPDTAIKGLDKSTSYIRTADEVEVIGRRGGLLSVGREGPLTGNRVDCFILDDLYKDAMEGNSPTIRENCWEWYTSVVRTRQHNNSQELIVFTRWHEEDLIGMIGTKSEVIPLQSLDDIKSSFEGYYHLNFGAIMDGEPTALDPRQSGEALWPEVHDTKHLEEKRKLDPMVFECMYQGHPSSREGLLYGDSFGTYEAIPSESDIFARNNYTDTADTGDDYLCSVSYIKGRDGLCYITDIVYSREPMEQTEPAVAEMLRRSGTRRSVVESNNGGRGFARAVLRLAPTVRIEWFHQSGNKEARILSNSASVLQTIRMPRDWKIRFPEFYTHLATYRRQFRANRWHDAADVLTGIIEQENTPKNKIKSIKFI